MSHTNKFAPHLHCVCMSRYENFCLCDFFFDISEDNNIALERRAIAYTHKEMSSSKAKSIFTREKAATTTITQNEKLLSAMEFVCKNFDANVKCLAPKFSFLSLDEVSRVRYFG